MNGQTDDWQTLAIWIKFPAQEHSTVPLVSLELAALDPKSTTAIIY